MKGIYNHKTWLALPVGILFLCLAGCQHAPVAIAALAAPRADIRTSKVYISPPSFSLKQDEFAAYKVFVPAYATNVRLEGKFTVDPRPFAQLDLILIREDKYDAWRAYPPDGVVYRSGNTSADKFRIPLPAGNYFLIFDNNLPSIGQNSYNAEPTRTVQAEMLLVYDRHF
jgi:hypothetical protein